MTHSSLYFKSYWFVLGFVCLIPFQLNAQTPTPSPTSSKGTETLALARKLNDEEGPTKALPEYEKALAIFQQEGDRKNEAITIGLLGNVYKNLGQNAKALELLERSLRMKRELGERLEEAKTLNNLGLFYWETSDYPKALEQYNKAAVIVRELGNKNAEAALHNNLGLVYDEIGDFGRSIEEYNKAMELYRGLEPNRGVTDTLGNIGGRHLLLGEYAEALRWYQQALEIDERLRLKPKITIDLENIGLCLIGLGRAQESLAILDRGIQLTLETGQKKVEADCRRAKASAFFQLGRYSDALKLYQYARQTYDSTATNTTPEFKQQLVEALGDLGNLEIRLGDIPSAEKDFQRALDISESIKHPRGVIVNLISLGELQRRLHRLPEALALYSRALTMATEANDRGHIALAQVQRAHVLRELKRLEDASREAQQAREVARLTQARLVEAEAVYALGEVYRAGGRHQDALTTFSEGKTIAGNSHPELNWRFEFARGQSLEALQRNEEALAAYQGAVSTIESVRNELLEERFRAGYIEDKYQVYVTLVQLLLKLGKPEEAFATAEKLRARSFLELLNRRPSVIRNPEQRRKETTLQSRIRELQKQIDSETAKPEPDQKRRVVEQYSSALSAAEHEYESFLDDLNSVEPNYSAIRRLKVPSGNEIKQRLPLHTALLEYVIADQAVVVFVITSDGLNAKVVATRNDDLNGRIETLRDLIFRNETNEWKLPAAALYRTLIEPIVKENWLKNISRLYIVPHETLHYVPFGILQAPNSRLLIDDYVVSYLPAAAVLIKRDDPKAVNSSILAMAPSSSRLKYTQLESKSVSTFFPSKHKVLLGPQATESSFKQLADSYDVIHLATHGYFNKANPLLSGLILESDANDDGKLEVHEIFGLKLKAKLVTLSACDTALGSGYFSDVPPGDDLVGLTRAFLSAGTPSVLASLWEVNDRSAVGLMESFYRRMKQTDKATALAQSQRLRRHGPYSHPYYWAAFVLIGEMK